jgi:hypothetical protein
MKVLTIYAHHDPTRSATAYWRGSQLGSAMPAPPARSWIWTPPGSTRCSGTGNAARSTSGDVPEDIRDLTDLRGRVLRSWLWPGTASGVSSRHGPCGKSRRPTSRR